MAQGHTAGQMWRWNLNLRLYGPAAHVPTLPPGASREGKEVKDRGETAWHGEEAKRTEWSGPAAWCLDPSWETGNRNGGCRELWPRIN